VTTRMPATDALRAVHEARRPEEIVVTTMATARDWMELGAGALDLVLVPSAMSHATSFGLGLALAQPERRVIVCNGDGSMLMNLGSLVTIAAAGATNLVVVLFDNRVYEVTGSQPTPGATDFAAMARAAGFSTVFRFDALEEWRSRARSVLDAPGPTFVALDVAATSKPGPKSPGPAAERARAFMHALSGGEGQPA
jgi:sulfopyruvate decarboxylase subunit beta